MASKNYSGKRVAGRKPVGKRALGLLMALVMSLSLVQITALAVDGRTNQVVNAGGTAYYKADGTEGNANDWAVKVKRTLAETGTENLFDVNLEVTTRDNTVSADAEAAAVLVIDTSGSMGWCATCGEGEDNENHVGQPVWKCPVGDTTWNPGPWNICKNCHYSGWDHTLVNVGPNHAYQSRLELAQFAANSFVASFAKNAAGEIASAPRYVAIVAFANKAITKCAWVDVTEGTTAVEAAINALAADGGTNTEAGLQLASNLLGQKDDVENRFAVLLTDGLPTFYIDPHDNNKRDSLDVVPSGYTTTEYFMGIPYTKEHSGVSGGGSNTTSAETAPVETVSKALKADGVKVYGVTYGVTEQIPNGNNVKKDIDTWMTEDCQMAGVHSVSNPNSLNAAFSDIINTIQNESVSTTVVTAVNNMTGEDDLKDLYTFVQFTKQNGATEDNNEVSWDLSKAAFEAGTAEGEKTYQMSYQVRMKTETTGFQQNTPYSLGAATLSFQVNGGTAEEVAFPVVTAKGYLGDFRFTKVESVGNEFAPLPGAEFQLSAANVKTLSATSDVNGGVVAFIGIPSGYTYTLSETKAPEGYTATVETWTVTVAYGEVIISQGNDVVGLDVVENTKTPVTPPNPEMITVTVNYVELDNADNVLREAQSKQFKMVDGAAAYDVTDLKFSSLDKDGKTYNYNSASENLTGDTQRDLSITLYYKVKSSEPIDPPVTPTYSYYTVTVNYYDKDSGEVIHEKYSTTQREYTSYDVTAQDAIAIEGYTYAETTGDALKGTLNGSKTINVYYTKASTPVEPPVTPVDPNPVTPPETGDAMGFWIAAAAVSGLGLVWLALGNRKRREEA